LNLWQGGPLPGTRSFVVNVSEADIRAFIGLPERGFPEGASWARPAGRRLAIHPLLANPRAGGLDVVLDVLEVARSVLVAVGVRFDVIRIRRGCAVVRAMAAGEVGADASCALTRGLLETVPAMARGVAGTAVETTCCRRGAESCLYTLLWDAGLGPTARYRPYGRHGPWAAQSGPAVAFVIDPDLSLPPVHPSGLSAADERGPRPPLPGREPGPEVGT
jgi:hypothetical protein